MYSAILFLWSALGMTIFQSAPGEVSLRWDPNQESDVVRYTMYWGDASRSYQSTKAIQGRTNTTTTITGLPAGRHFFAVTAVNSADLESGFSNEVSATVQGGAPSKCDRNGDGLVNVLDFQLLANVILQGASCPSCDLNGDGTTNVSDLQKLVNVILGSESCPE